MKRRNADCGKLRRPLKRPKIGEGVYGSVFTYIKFFMVWALVLMADFILDFRFEYLWPVWLVMRSVYDSFKYQGLAFSIFFVCITITSDVVCYLLIPVQWLFFTASTYVWVQYVWQTERGVCLPTVLLWLIFLYIEVAVRLRDLKSFPFQLDLCRPFAAHCIGYPVITMGFSFKSCISYRFHVRKQREVEKANSFYFDLLDQALPSDVVQNNRLRALPVSSSDDVLATDINNTTTTSTTTSTATSTTTNSLSRTSLQRPSLESNGCNWSNDDLEFLENPSPGCDDDDSDSSHSALPVNGSIKRHGSSSKDCGTGSSGSTINTTVSPSNNAANTSTAVGGGRKKLNLTTNNSTNNKSDANQVTSKLEADIKRLKADLQSSRCTEQELRSQMSSLSTNERTAKIELCQLRQDNDSLQTKLQKLMSSRQQDKQNLAMLEKRLADERKQKTALEQQLATEKLRRKTDESVAAAARNTARTAECVSEPCKTRRWELDNEVKQLRRELQLREDRLRQLERETQSLHQKRESTQSETEVLMSALGAIQDKNTHLETSLSAETRLKLDLFSALGDAKRQIEIQQGLLMQKEMELCELKNKVAEVMVFLPNVTSFTASPVRYSPAPSYVSVMQPTVHGDMLVHGADLSSLHGEVLCDPGSSNLNPGATDYTPKISQ